LYIGGFENFVKQEEKLGKNRHKKAHKEEAQEGGRERGGKARSPRDKEGRREGTKI
jgi:hypothetical protein